jgi:hypothetical protein
MEKPAERDQRETQIRQLNQLLTGPRTTTMTMTVDVESGLTPPPWWKGDEEASRSSLTALTR